MELSRSVCRARPRQATGRSHSHSGGVVVCAHVISAPPGGGQVGRPVPWTWSCLPTQ